MWTCEEVYQHLKDHRQIKATTMIVQEMLQHAIEGSENAQDLSLLKTFENNKKKYAIVLGWLEMLSTEQRFIIQTHLIDGLDWARTIVEHEKKWGIQNGRSERTLKRIQAKAIRQIVASQNKIEEIL